MALELPLAGVRIVDLTMNMSGPFGTMLLADEGAQVVKVEPPAGDPIRDVGSGRAGLTAYFANLNRNKSSIVVDLTTADGVDVVRSLAAQADVFIQNFRPGVADRLGIGAPVLREADPALIYLSICGFGPSGPLRDVPAYDHVVQALSGMAARQDDGKSGPALVKHGLIDKVTGYAAAQAITAALLQRHRTNIGATISLSMLDVAVGFLWPDGMMDRTCEAPERRLPPVAGSFRVTKTADGYLSLVTLTGRQWQGLLDATGVAAVNDPRTTADRMAFGADTMREVVRRIGQMATDEAVELLIRHGVPCAPVVSLDDVPDVAQIVANETLFVQEHPVLGRIRQPRLAPRWADRSPDRREPAPSLGQQTDPILTGLGLTPDRIDDLRHRKIIA